MLREVALDPLRGVVAKGRRVGRPMGAVGIGPRREFSCLNCTYIPQVRSVSVQKSRFSCAKLIGSLSVRDAHNLGGLSVGILRKWHI